MTETRTDGQQPDAVDILTADHRAMLELLREIEGTTGPSSAVTWRIP